MLHFLPVVGILMVDAVWATETSVKYCPGLVGLDIGMDKPIVGGTSAGCGASWCPEITNDGASEANDRQWTEADGACKDAGMRLCTIQELEGGRASGTGCGGDNREVWSSTSCGADRYWTWHELHADQKRCRQHDGTSNGNQGVRCCADFETSASTCDVLVGQDKGFHWGIQIRDGGCGASWCPDVTNGVASEPKDRWWTKAEQECRAREMRLCTIQELKDGMADGTGCDGDWNDVWSADVCNADGNHFKTWNKGTAEEKCLHKDASANDGLQVIRCCADNAPPTPAPTTAPTTAAYFEAASLSAALDVHQWRTGVDGDTVYKCDQLTDLCFSNVAGDRGQWKIFEGIPSVEMGGNPTITTPDGTVFKSDEEKITVQTTDGVLNKFPWECACT